MAIRGGSSVKPRLKERTAWMRVPKGWGPFWIHGKHIRLLKDNEVVFESNDMPFWTSLGYELSRDFLKGNRRQDGFIIEVRQKVRGRYVD